MAVITMPSSPKPRRVQLSLRQPTQVNRSEWTGRRKVTILAGAPMWLLAAEYPPIVGEANILLWRAFLVQLQGQANTFRLRLSEGAQRVGSNPSVNGAGQTGTALSLSGLTPSATNLRAGHWLTVPLTDGTWQAVQLIADLTANASGVGTAAFRPWLRAAASNGGACESVYPWVELALTSDTTGWGVEPGQIYSLSLDCEEAF